jgi:hypothetical protein
MESQDPRFLVDDDRSLTLFLALFWPVSLPIVAFYRLAQRTGRWLREQLDKRDEES